MYKALVEIKTADGDTMRLNCETAAVKRCKGINYYFDCSKCKNQSIGDETGTVWDCNNYIEVESAQRTRHGGYKIYCPWYQQEDKK